MKKAIVLLADGFEDVEAVTPIDYLRRAGIEVTTASISKTQTVTSKWGGIKLTADTILTEQIINSEWDAVILPGGMPGAVNLAASKDVTALLQKTAEAGRLVCAICASPVLVLAPLGILAGKKFTCYPGLEEKVTNALWQKDRVVVDGSIITSRAAGTTGEFALAIVEKLLDKEAAKKLSDILLL